MSKADKPRDMTDAVVTLCGMHLPTISAHMEPQLAFALQR
jgi:hypothetical protein